MNPVRSHARDKVASPLDLGGATSNGMKNLPGKKLEKKLFKQGYKYICAVDEVGVGCLAGPVVVCAVGIDKYFHLKSRPGLRGLKESKLLSARQREKFVAQLMGDKNMKYAIASCSPKTIDKLNIYQAARRAMRRAVKKVTSFHLPVSNKLSSDQLPKLKTENWKLKTMILVDGKNKIKGIKHEQQAIIKGDRKIFAIACASIIAKVHRDNLMTKMAKRYPGYGFEKHKGYGTKYHQAQLAKLGSSAIHRQSFAPVAKMI